jgi:hypothetical protein
LTGRGLPAKTGRVKFSNSDAAEIIDQLARKLSVRDLGAVKK